MEYAVWLSRCDMEYVVWLSPRDMEYVVWLPRNVWNMLYGCRELHGICCMVLAKCSEYVVKMARNVRNIIYWRWKILFCLL